MTRPGWQNGHMREMDDAKTFILHRSLLKILIALLLISQQIYSTSAFVIPSNRFNPTTNHLNSLVGVRLHALTSSNHPKSQDEEETVKETNGKIDQSSRKYRWKLNRRSNNDSKASLGERAVTLYVGYAKKLWRETSADQRKRLARENAIASIEKVNHLVDGVGLGGAFWDMNDEKDDEETKMAKRQMGEACERMLAVLKREKETILESGQSLSKDRPLRSNGSSALEVKPSNQEGSEDAPTKKKSRSVVFGAIMGALVACWVFSGNFVFTALFTLMTVLGQLEYYRMVMKAGIYPARRISVLGACAMFVTALFAPTLHQVCLPVFATWAMVWFLTMRRSVSTISEIATTFTGMFYLGYVPSFWVRTRLIGGNREPTRLAPLVAPMLRYIGHTASSLPKWMPKAIHLPITSGAIFIFWAWLCIAFSDVGAYFAGRRFGKTKLSVISPAAGATSPNKTVEGVIGGCTISAVLATLGAWVQKWPYWYVIGPLHGVMLALLGLVGDLTASMLKRDAGIKDFGDLIPEHGGIMDRVDSFIFSAPYGYLFLSHFLPTLRAYVTR